MHASVQRPTRAHVPQLTCLPFSRGTYTCPHAEANAYDHSNAFAGTSSVNIARNGYLRPPKCIDPSLSQHTSPFVLEAFALLCFLPLSTESSMRRATVSARAWLLLLRLAYLLPLVQAIQYE
eukprot:6207833-Pleurochrysis_carterae.AAC.3